MKKLTLLQIGKTGLISALLFTTSVMAQERHIHINGEHLSDEEILIADQLWGGTLMNNYYWLNYETGEWGYENSHQVEGVLQAWVDVVNQSQNQGGYSNSSNTEINSSQNGSVVSGNLNGQNCTFASAGGMTFKSCD